MFVPTGFAPTKEDKIINYVGECTGSSGGYRCGLCEGDCDSDSDCEDGLVCVSRDGFEPVPGCSGEGGSRDMWVSAPCYDIKTPLIITCTRKILQFCCFKKAKDVCRKAELVEYRDSLRINPGGCSSASECSKCEGPCLADGDCSSGLHCFVSRVDFSPIPNCVTGGAGDIGGASYCYQKPPDGTPTYVPGDLTVYENGLELSTGLQSRIIARTGDPVLYINGSSSSTLFHKYPDGAAVFNVTSEENEGG